MTRNTYSSVGALILACIAVVVMAGASACEDTLRALQQDVGGSQLANPK